MIAAVVAVALVVALLVAMVSVSQRHGPQLLDPEAEERWIVAHVAARAGLLRLFGHRPDRERAGAALLAVAFVVTFATAAAVGLVLTMVNRSEGLAELDESVAEWGSEHVTATGLDVIDAVTQLGGTPVLAAVLVAVGIVDYIRHRRRDVLLFLLVVGVGQVLLTNGLKELVGRERPPVPHLSSAGGPSFPSGHSASAAACWAAVALVLSRHWSHRARGLAAGAAASVAAAVAASRALLGVHWLTDIVAGVALGWGWFTLVAIAFGGRLQRLGEPAERATARAHTDAVRRDAPSTTS
jgi:membrane-associated phospholipid phosphatase